MIVHTLEMCTGDTGPEQSLVLFNCYVGYADYIKKLFTCSFMIILYCKIGMTPIEIAALTFTYFYIAKLALNDL